MKGFLAGVIVGVILSLALQAGAWVEEMATKRALMGLESRISAVEADVAVICLRTSSTC